MNSCPRAPGLLTTAFMRAPTEALKALCVDRHPLLAGPPFTADDSAVPLQPIEQRQLDALMDALRAGGGAWQ